MSLSSLKPVAFSIPPVAGANGSHSKPSKVTVMSSSSSSSSRQALPPPPPLLQVMKKEKEKTVLKEESFTTASRREMMHLTAASVGFLSLLLPEIAEARPRNATMRQKIMEKFDQLRQKAGLSKPKDESEGKKPKEEDKPKTKEMKPKMKKGGEEEKSKATPHHSALPQSEGGPSAPALPSILNGKTIETSLP